MERIDIPKEALLLHQEQIGRPVEEILDCLANGGFVAWRHLRKDEASYQSVLSLACGPAATSFWKWLSGEFKSKKILIARPSVLLGFLRVFKGNVPCVLKDAIEEVLKHIFDYSKFAAGYSLSISGQNGMIEWTNRPTVIWGAYHFVRMLGVHYCPYCNAETVGAAVLRCKDGRVKLHHSELDHFLPKSRYPVLALSLYNLIPSCTRCNSRFKGASDCFEEYLKNGRLPILHPYVDHPYKHFAFEYAPDSIDKMLNVANLQTGPLKMCLENRGKKDQTRKFLVQYHLPEIYSQFYNLELMHAIKACAIYTKSMRRCLEKSYPGITRSEMDDVFLRTSLDPRRINCGRFAKANIDMNRLFGLDISRPHVRRISKMLERKM